MTTPALHPEVAEGLLEAALRLEAAARLLRHAAVERTDPELGQAAACRLVAAALGWLPDKG